jgi:hypothetical protein
LFGEISEQFSKEIKDDQIVLWSSLPFFAKFMGDGVLFLWETDKSGPMGLGNTALHLAAICDSYVSTFLKEASQAHSKTPSRLRVGIARGQVFSVGEGSDWVAPCINTAARLQKLGSLPFALSRKGFNPKKCFIPSMQRKFAVVKTSVRGVGEDETVIVRKADLGALDECDRALFRSAT